MFNYYVLAFKKYADFKGVATRPEYWWFVLANMIVGILLGAVDLKLGSTLLSNIYQLVVLVPSLAVVVRRLHDAGHSGLNLLWIIVPEILVLGQAYLNYGLPEILTLLVAAAMLIAAIVVFVWLCMPSKTANNKYRR